MCIPQATDVGTNYGVESGQLSVQTANSARTALGLAPFATQADTQNVNTGQTASTRTPNVVSPTSVSPATSAAQAQRDALRTQIAASLRKSKSNFASKSADLVSAQLYGKSTLGS